MTKLETFFHEGGISVLGPLPILFASRQEGMDFMMDIVGEVMQELKAEGVPIPSEKQFIKDVTELMVFYRRFSKSEY